MPPTPTAKSKYMTGNWDGWRDVLEKNGVFVTSSFTTDMLGNPVGGVARGFSYAGSFGLNLGVDFNKVCGWTGFEFFTSYVWRTGTSLSRTKIGNQFPVQQVFGSQTVKLNELYFKESLFNKRLCLKAGRLDLGNDFLASPLYGRYVNNAFDGNPISVFFNDVISAYPNATWGAYLRLQPIDLISAKFAVYNANSKIHLNKYHGFNFTFSSTNGVIWITEWTLLVNQGAQLSDYPGNYKVGAFYQTANTQIFSGGVGGDPCYYFLFDQAIAKGITPFVAMLFQPKDRNLFPFFYTAGVVFNGIFPHRPEDALALGMAYGKYSHETGTHQNFESILELNYWFQVNEWCQVAPDAQLILHPKGTDIPNAFCLGAQIGFLL
ncbi:MAG: carbohydrate porin [Chlamydiia bacterium]|nr:carbohydrate porin [Chlamydiia bacterium]